MDFFADCIKPWQEKSEKEVNLMKQLESLENCLEKSARSRESEAQDSVSLEDCWAQNGALKNIVRELTTLQAGELAKTSKPLVMERVFDLLIGIRCESFHITNKFTRVQERKSHMEEDEQKEVEFLGKSHSRRDKEIEELTRRFEESWGEQWQQVLCFVVSLKVIACNVGCVCTCLMLTLLWPEKGIGVGWEAQKKGEWSVGN